MKRAQVRSEYSASIICRLGKCCIHIADVCERPCPASAEVASSVLRNGAELYSECDCYPIRPSDSCVLGMPPRYVAITATPPRLELCGGLKVSMVRVF